MNEPLKVGDKVRIKKPKPPHCNCTFTIKEVFFEKESVYYYALEGIHLLPYDWQVEKVGQDE